ncbi:hypothetical protein G4B88_003444, partial [Cannabis sativa]
MVIVPAFWLLRPAKATAGACCVESWNFVHIQLGHIRSNWVVCVSWNIEPRKEKILSLSKLGILAEFSIHKYYLERKNILNVYIQALWGSSTATQKSWRGLGSEAEAMKAAKANTTTINVTLISLFCRTLGVNSWK